MAGMLLDSEVERQQQAVKAAVAVIGPRQVLAILIAEIRKRESLCANRDSVRRNHKVLRELKKAKETMDERP